MTKQFSLIFFKRIWIEVTKEYMIYPWQLEFSLVRPKQYQYKINKSFRRYYKKKSLLPELIKRSIKKCFSALQYNLQEEHCLTSLLQKVYFREQNKVYEYIMIFHPEPWGTPFNTNNGWNLLLNENKNSVLKKT